LGENVTVRVAGRQAAKRPGAMQRPMPVIGAWFRYYFFIDKLERKGTLKRLCQH
jgi:hypothetical protein